MNFKVLVFLALLVTGLVFLTRYQQGIERQQVEAYNGPLLGDARPERIVEIRWDHVADNRQVALELQEGQWVIVDPIDFPAAPHQVKLLMDGLFRDSREVPEPDTAAVASHFDPPRIDVTLIESMEGGSLREHRFQVGALDADGMQVEVKKDGRYLRTLRNLDTALAVSVGDLRKRRIFGLNPERLVRIERSGFSDITGTLLDLEFTAGREGPTWQQSSPLQVQLDPSVMDVWGRQLCSIYAGDFVSDVQDPDLVQYGLNLPNAKLVLTEASGRSQELWISQSGSGAWVAKRVDQPYVYSLIPEQLSLVLDDWSMLRDTRLLRAHRQDVDSIELLSSNGTIRLTQGPDLDDDWSVAFRAQGAAAFGMDWLAEKATVQEFLGLVEQSEVTDWLPVTEQNASQVFAKGHTFSRFTFHFRHVLKGEQSSGLVGPIHTSSLGTSLRMFSRVGDDPVGLIPLEFHDWLERPLQGWRSRLVWDLKEGRLSRLKLSQGETVREYKRKIQGTWTYVDAETTPVELLPALDHLVFLRAEEHLAEGSQTVLSNPVAVEFFDVDGFQHPALIGPDGEGRIQIQVRGQSSIAKNQDLYRLLVDILGR